MKGSLVIHRPKKPLVIYISSNIKPLCDNGFHIESLEPRPKTKKQLAQKALPGETYNEVKKRLKEDQKPKKISFWKSLFKS